MSTLAIGAAAIVGWFLYDPLLKALQEPLQEATVRGHLAKLNFAQIGAAFNLKIRISIYLGIVLACPVWLYQIWAFIVPGLTRREKRYAMSFVGASIPLFLAGLYLAWLVLPNAVAFLTDFTPNDSVNYITADEYLTFVTKIMIAFGIAFLVPVFLVALNMVGVLPARTMLRGWRVAVFLNFLFAAIASPTPDAGTMIALAMPMVALYFAAVGIAWTVDRRRSRANPFTDLADDEASPLDDAPFPVEAPLPVDRPDVPVDRPDVPVDRPDGDGSDGLDGRPGAEARDSDDGPAPGPTDPRG